MYRYDILIYIYIYIIKNIISKNYFIFYYKKNKYIY